MLKSKLKFSRLFILLLGVTAFIQGAYAQQYPIVGSVSDEHGNPIEGVDVFIHETHQGTVTDSSGQFLIPGVKKGHYHIHVTYTGFHSYEQDITVSSSLKPILVVLHESVNELHQVVIESSLEKSSLRNNPLQVVHVDQHFLQQQGGSSFMKKLEKIPGISSINNGVGVSKPSIRGLTGNRVVVTTNGIKQEGQQWGSDHGLELDVNNADRIEIIKGASTLLYGSDAVAGVINVRPKLPKGKEQYNVGQLVGFNSINNSMRYSTFLSANKKGWWYKIRYSGMKGGDYKIPSDEFKFQSWVLPVYRQRLKNTALREDVVNAYVGISKNWGYWYARAGYFDQQSGFFAGAFGVPSVAKLIHDNSFTNIDLPYQSVKHYTLSTHGNIMLHRNWLEVDAGIQRNDRMELAQPHSGAFSGSTEDFEALKLDLVTYTLNARYFLRDSLSKTIIGLSGQVRNNDVGGYEFIIPSYNSTLFAIYGVHNRTIKKGWKLNSGVRLEWNALRYDSSLTPYYRNGEFYGQAFRTGELNQSLPGLSLSVGVNKEFNHEFYMKANLAKTARMLQANELASNGLHHGAFRFERGNDQLDMEQGLQSDVSFTYEHKRLLLTSTVYFNHFFNFVYLRPSAQFARLVVNEEVLPYPEAGQLFEFTQAAVQHFGGEFEFEVKVISELKAYVTSEYTQINNLDVDEHVPFVAPLSVKPGLEYIKKDIHKRIEELHIDANVGLFGRQYRVPKNDIPTEAYQLLSLSSALYLHNGLELTLTGNNLLNTSYFSNLSRYKIIGLPEPGRSVVVRLNYTFRKKSA